MERSACGLVTLRINAIFVCISMNKFGTSELNKCEGVEGIIHEFYRFICFWFFFPKILAALRKICLFLSNDMDKSIDRFNENRLCLSCTNFIVYFWLWLKVLTLYLPSLQISSLLNQSINN